MGRKYIKDGGPKSLLYSLIQTSASGSNLPRNDVLYCLYELTESFAWFTRPDTADEDVLPISMAQDLRYTLGANPDRYHWLLTGENGGVIYWGGIPQGCPSVYHQEFETGYHRRGEILVATVWIVPWIINSYTGVPHG